MLLDYASRDRTARYIGLMCPDHPRAKEAGYVREHVLVAEKALGHYLPEGAIVHHVDEDVQNNKPNNLVICQDNAYHRLIHVRMRVVRHGGNPNTDKVCGGCSTAKSKTEFTKLRRATDGLSPFCSDCSKIKCHAAYEKRCGRAA